MAQIDDDLGARVRAARSYAGLSQNKLAEAIGVERRVVLAIEADGDRHPLSIREARKIADVCRVPVGFLVEGWNVNRPIQDRLSEIERRLGEVADRDGVLTAHERELLSRFEELIQRLGRDIGRGQPRSRGAKSFPAAATERGQ